MIHTWIIGDREGLEYSSGKSFGPTQLAFKEVIAVHGLLRLTLTGLVAGRSLRGVASGVAFMDIKTSRSWFILVVKVSTVVMSDLQV